MHTSTDDNPQHQLCDISWCRYKQAIRDAKTYEHKNSLDQPIIDLIKPIFRDLAKTELLELLVCTAALKILTKASILFSGPECQKITL
ncbi:hypothetical protein J6590_064349 [Homalodisca vitripennis]|nr:hypothetical protein J6590_064349 [Homalodisca vitripennis]